MNRIVNPDSLPSPAGYSHAVVAEGSTTIYVAGQIGCDRTGSIVSSDVVEQFEAALKNVVTALAACGADAGSIVRITVYVTDMVQYRSRLKGLGEAWRRVMGRRYPAMSVLEVKGLFDSAARVELEVTAVT